MQFTKTMAGGFCILVLGGVSVPPGLLAQTIWHDRTRPQSVWLEFNHVEFEGEGSGFLTSSNAIGGRYRLTEVGALTIELPFANADLDGPADSDFSIGNPYLAYEYAPNDAFLLETGVRVPIGSGSDFGALAGLSAEYADRTPAYLDDVVSVHVVPNLLAADENGFRARLRGGPAVWIPTGGGDVELILDYGGTVGYENGGFGGDLGITGWMIVTQGNLDFGQRTVFQLGGQLYRRLGGGGRLGALVRFPLDDELENVDFVLGLKASLAVD